MDTEARAAGLRRTAYTLMALATVAAVAARILSAERVFEPSMYRPDPAADVSPAISVLGATMPLVAATDLAAAESAWRRIDPLAPPRVWPRTRPRPMPTFSSNDRSRWATVRALVDDGTFAVGRRTRDESGRTRDVGIVFEDGWQTVDKVMNPETGVFYSSKPPLLSVLLAGEYWLIQRLTGWTLADHPWPVICTILLTIHVLPLIAYLLVLARLLERFGASDWGRLFTFAAACFATYVTTFAISLNNHTLAAFTTLFAVAPLLTSASRRRELPSLGDLGWCGLFAGLTFCLELPAATLLAGLAVGCTYLAPRRALLVFLPAAALPIAAQLGTNYAALGDVWPAYAKVDSPWYRYAGSHWGKRGPERRGIDFAGDYEDRATYAFQLLAGHHGLFSLTPIWLLALGGLAQDTRRSERGPRWRQVALLTAGTSAVVIVFFAGVVGTVNYGGFTNGPRWFFWLTPLWLLAMLTMADRLAGSRTGRAVGYTFLAASVFSTHFMPWNPWRHPWIYQLLDSLGQIPYG